MLDTHAVARSLTAAEFTPAQADAITDAVRQAAEYGDQVTSDQFKTGLAELRTEMAGQRAELTGQFAELGGQITEQRAEVAGGAHRNRDADRRGARPPPDARRTSLYGLRAGEARFCG